MNITTSCRVWMKTSLFVMALSLGASASCSDSTLSGDVPNPEETPEDVPDGGTEPPDGGDPGGNPDQGTIGGGPLTPPTEINGTETPVSAAYWPRGVDLGVVDPDENFRAIVVFQLRNQAELASNIERMYDPNSTEFRKYKSVSDFMSRHAPTLSTVDAVKGWLTSKGFTIARTAKNRLMLQYTGTVRQFNTAFNTELHLIRRSETTWRAPAYAPLSPLDVPQPLIGQVKRLLMPDPEAESGTLNPDVAPILTTPPIDVGSKLSPAQIAKAYGISELYAQGYKGSGMTIGVVGATLFRNSDAQSMWQTFGISRANPTVIQTMEPIITRDLETTLDIQLAGALAPEAEILYYGGPNNSDTSLLYTYNEAIADARAQVLSDSFAHAEATTPYPVSLAYNESSMMAAALGITVLSASGDSNQVDVPSNSPYVTAVGGTNVELNTDDTWRAEQSWGLSGCGLSRIFSLPLWQTGEYGAAKNRRAVADVGAVVGPYWVKYLAKWTYADGTSASTPVFAAVIALVDQSRKARGKPPVGFLNSLIYKNAATRGAFRDITQIGYGGCAVTSGYDLATGIGSPKAAELAVAIP
jgi:kumamolisin